MSTIHAMEKLEQENAYLKADLGCADTEIERLREGWMRERCAVICDSSVKYNFVGGYSSTCIDKCLHQRINGDYCKAVINTVNKEAKDA